VERLRAVSNKIRHVESYLLWGIVAVLLFSMGFIHGCEAVGGFGRDITWTAEAGQEMLRHGHEAGRK